MNEVYDWPMFWVTVVYVIATLAIVWVSWHNGKTVEKQIIESKRQFEENQRLEKLPYLSCEIGDWVGREERVSIYPDMWIHVNNDYKNENTSGAGYSIGVSNIGLGMADRMKCESVCGEIRSEHTLPFRLLRCGEERKLSFFISANKTSVEHQYEQLKIIFYYNDLLSNRYKQELEMEVDVKTGTVSIIRYLMHSPVWLGKATDSVH